jgi:zinc protease
MWQLRTPSGLRVVVEQDSRSPVVAVVAMVGAGGVNDPAGKEGMAHVVEHLAFRARHSGSPSVSTRLEQLGAGRFNASTSLEHTAYETLVPRESLPALLKLEFQRLSAPLEGVTEQVLAVEREVVLNELLQGNETGFTGQILPWVQRNSFPEGDPYARPVIGSHDSISQLTLADAQRFVREHYQPDNMTLMIAGDVDLAAIEALLQQHLPKEWRSAGQPMRSQQAGPSSKPPLAPKRAKLLTYRAAVVSPELYLSWVLPGGFDEASAVHDMVSASLSSKVFGAMLADEDIADVSTALMPGRRASLLLVRVVLNTGAHPAESADKVMTEVFSLWDPMAAFHDRQGWERSFQQLRRAVIINRALEGEDLLTRTARSAEQAHFLKEARGYGEAERALARISNTEMTDFAHRWLKRDRARILLVRPGESRVPPLPFVQRLSSDEEGVAPPRVRMLAALEGSAPVISMSLNNGLEVLLAPRPGLPLVSVGVALGGGEASGNPGVAMLADFAAFPKSEFQGEPRDYGLRRSSHLYRDHLRYTLAGASGNVGNMLAILAEQLDSMGTEFDLLRFFDENVLPRRKATDASPEQRAEQALLRVLYGAHPYGHLATAEELDKVTQSDVEGWISRVHSPANAVVVIAGEFDPQQVMPWVQEHLGGWKGTGTPVEAPPFPALAKPSTRPELLLTPFPEAAQGYVQVACRLPEATPAAEARYALMASVFEASMWRQLREQMGATYGFQTQVSMMRGGAAHLLLRGVVDASRLEAAMTAVRATLAAYAHEGVPAAEVERARGRLLAEQAVSVTTSGDWVNMLLNVRVLGWGVDALTLRPQRLQAVTPAEFQKEFAACAERLVVGITGDPGQAQAAAQAAFP